MSYFEHSLAEYCIREGKEQVHLAAERLFIALSDPMELAKAELALAEFITWIDQINIERHK